MSKIDSAFLTFATNILADTEKGLSGSKIVEHLTSFSIDYNKVIPYGSYPFPKSIPNKRTALKKNIEAFPGPEQFQIILYLCELPLFNHNEDAKDLKIKLYTRYGSLSKAKLNNSELIVKTKHWLENYPNALEVYSSALTKYEASIFERNTLDDMRLAFELFIKAVINNNKSLENQKAELGRLLKDKDASPQCNNMITTLISYYTDYQNQYVKHNDLVNENEIEFIIELTSTLMKFLIKMLG